MIRNPKNIKQEVKIWIFYMVDAGIIAGMTICGVYISKMFPLQPIVAILVWIVFFLLGVFFCVRVPQNPKDRMILMILYCILVDRHTYEEVFYDEKSKLRSK